MQTKKMLTPLFSLIAAGSLLITGNAIGQTDSISKVRSNETGQDINQMQNPNVHDNTTTPRMQGDSMRQRTMHRDSLTMPDAHQQEADVQPVPATPPTPSGASVKPAKPIAPASSTAVKPAKPVTPATQPGSKGTVKSKKSKEEKTMYLVPDSNVVRDPKK